MLAAHVAGFINLINDVLEDIFGGVLSPHHLHNVDCGIENIVSLLKPNNEVVEGANQLARRARDYVTYHELVMAKTHVWASSEGVDRLRAVREALASFGSAVAHSQPNSRAHTLGLA